MASNNEEKEAYDTSYQLIANLAASQRANQVPKIENDKSWIIILF